MLTKEISLLIIASLLRFSGVVMGIPCGFVRCTWVA